MLAERKILFKSPILTPNASDATPNNAVEISPRVGRRTKSPRRRRTLIFLFFALNWTAAPFETAFDTRNVAVSSFAVEQSAPKTDVATPELVLPNFLDDSATSKPNDDSSNGTPSATDEAAGATNSTIELARNFDSNFKNRVDFSSVSPNATGSDRAVSSVENVDERSTLEISDVEEFSAETKNAPREYKNDADSPNSNPPAKNETLDQELDETFASDETAATPEQIADECFCALDPFSSLFIEYEPTAAWTKKTLEYVEAILPKLESNPLEAAELVKKFRAEIADGERLKAAIADDDRRLSPLYEVGQTADSNDGDSNDASSNDASSNDASSNDGDSKTTSRAPILRYSLEQRLELFESFRGALDRRAFVWTRAAEFFAAKKAGRLVAATEIATPELARIQKTTAAARSFFGESPTGRNWRTSFEIDLLAEDVDRLLKASTTFVPTTSAKIELKNASKSAPSDVLTGALPNALKNASKIDVSTTNRDDERALRTKYLRDRLNSVCYKLEKTPMTPEQRRVFQRSPLDEWVASVAPCSCDRTNGLELLLDFERYEGSGGGQSGRKLQQNARRMTTSRSDVCRKFGDAFNVVYDNPNVKAYISEALINRLLPIKDPEFDVVQETVLNNPVAGRRRTDAQVFIELVPDSSRLLMNLNVAGRVVAATSSTVFPATLHNQSYATYFGQKTLEWRDSGLAYSPTTVSSDSASKLSSVQTEVDFVPIVGDLAREVVRSQYESKQNAIRQETKARVAREVRERIDREANERFDAVNRRLRENFFADLSRLSLSLRTQRSKTTDEWLLASLRFGSDFSLGCQSTEPATLPGAFADLKIHESALNAAFAELDLGGKTTTPRQTLVYLAEKLNKPALANLPIDESELVFSFADVDPIVVRFFEDRIQLRLKFSELSLGSSNWNDVEVAVSYRPQTGNDGSATFVRDGVVELDGPLNIRAQIPLRAIFSKVFPAEKSLDLRPKILQTDERFAGLALGLCRVSRGWFAISVVCPGR